MSTRNTRDQWDNLTQRQKEEIWKKNYGTGIIPQNISNYDISNVMKNETNYNQRKERDDDSGFGKDIRGSI